MQKKRMSNVKLVSLICVGFFIIIVIFCLWAGVTQERERMREMKETAAQKLSEAPKDTELRVAYWERVSTEPHIVRVRPLPSGGHELLQDLGKIDDEPEK